jgi:beta-phosphoglucomutase-like phosphatase (HAD superfamily)
MQPAGLIFDCDGTLADTMPLHWRVWRALAERHSFAFNEERFYALGGVPTRDIVTILAREQGLALDPLAIAREKEAGYLALLTEVAPIPAIVGIAWARHAMRPAARIPPRVETRSKQSGSFAAEAAGSPRGREARGRLARRVIYADHPGVIDGRRHALPT